MNETSHRVIHADSRYAVAGDSFRSQLVVTSPPYPMIEMWDSLFSSMSPEIGRCVERGHASDSFELMHLELDKVWKAVYASLDEGGIACVVVGDATRSVGGSFRLFPNHSRITQSFASLGFEPLPGILWRKQSNKPNKFMGSGMLPPSAYPTMEHEHILIFRKGGNRTFRSEMERANRRRSAFFWEERNEWFSDCWEGIKGERQQAMPGLSRSRNASFPLEIAYRLVNMFSVLGDTVLDPFLGAGTTSAAAAQCGRSSIGLEIDSRFGSFIGRRLALAAASAEKRLSARLDSHRSFVRRCRSSGVDCRYVNRKYGFAVRTSQETDIDLPLLDRVKALDHGIYRADYR